MELENGVQSGNKNCSIFLKITWFFSKTALFYVPISLFSVKSGKRVWIWDPVSPPTLACVLAPSRGLAARL
jgi:hypothetical protein